MNINHIDLNLFVVLDAIYTEGSLTRAAQRLHLSQPAVSHALGRLRRMLNDPLFVRQGGTMIPTACTRNMIAPVRTALAGLASTIDREQPFEPAISERQLTLGLRDIFEAMILPPLQSVLAEQAPRMQMISVRTNRAEIEAELIQGKLDLALDIAMPVGSDIAQQALARERMVVVARRDHPRIGETLDLTAYLAEQHILVSTRRQGGGMEDFALQRLGHTRAIRLRCQHYFAACRVVSQSDLLLTMPEQYARLVSASLNTECHALPFDSPEMAIYLYWHASAENDPANRWLREQLMQQFDSAQPFPSRNAITELNP